MKCDQTLRKQFDSISYIDFSDLGSYHSKNVFRDFSIKYVFRGAEHYKTDHGTFEVKENELLFSNSESGEVYTEENKQRNIGVCIFLKRDLLTEILKINAIDCLDPDPENG
jgi:hypothetical protein